MSRQFDVFANPIRAGRDERPYLVVIQHGFFAHLTMRVLAPLVVKSVVREPSRAHPPLQVKGETFFLLPTNLVTLSLTHLRNPVANLESNRDKIIAAIDLMLIGA